MLDVEIKVVVFIVLVVEPVSIVEVDELAMVEDELDTVLLVVDVSVAVLLIVVLEEVVEVVVLESPIAS